jgi:formyltetrahydrofolate deformylase
MQITITAVGPDHVGLADPIIHYATTAGANIAEIQMYNHDDEALFAMLLRIELAEEEVPVLRTAMEQIGELKNLSIRVWCPGVRAKPRLAICTTYRTEPVLALLRAIRDGHVNAMASVMMGNRNTCRGIAEQFRVPWHNPATDGEPDDERMVELFDEYDVDFIVLARYMRILPASTCWKYAGGRIINLHHGILPSFPGMRPYHEAFASRMLTYGATCHFIVPDLDAGNQIICQSTFTVPPGLKLDEIVRIGQEDNEPRCLVEGVRRAVDREVSLHFHRVVNTKPTVHR